MDAKLKCASARQATKFPWKTSEVKVMDTKGPNYEDEWKSPGQKDAKLILKKEQKKKHLQVKLRCLERLSRKNFHPIDQSNLGTPWTVLRQGRF